MKDLPLRLLPSGPSAATIESAMVRIVTSISITSANVAHIFIRTILTLIPVNSSITVVGENVWSFSIQASSAMRNTIIRTNPNKRFAGVPRQPQHFAIF